MMMSKPQEEAEAEANGTDGVADLERRLAGLGSGENDPQAFAAAPPQPAVAPAATQKNALLARIQAAQERARQAQPKAPPPAADLLGFDPMSAAPPPAAATTTPTTISNEPAPAAADNTFDMLGEAFDSKPAATATAPPAPAAPTSGSTFEDLLSGATGDLMSLQADHQTNADGEKGPPPQTQEEIEEEILAGLEGLSDAEKKALLEEQRKIMAEIERNKAAAVPAAPLSAADAFDQRSNAAVARIAGGDRVNLPGKEPHQQQQRTVKLGENEVALHGQERTREAIKDGTAILTKCTNCSNWMQVTDNASLMFCPVCQVVSPIDRENAVATKEEALQMEADRKLAEELQNEEYNAQRAERRQRRAQREQQQQQAAAAKQGDSWLDWLGLGSGDATTAAAQRPPGGVPQSGSYDGEDRRLLGTGGGGGGGGPPRMQGGARVAEAKPLFSCIADSVTLAASSLTGAYNAQNLTTDEEGNMNGVDGSSLLR